MNILFINCMEITAPGGINKTVREIAMLLSNKGHRVTVLQANPLNLPSEEIYEGFKIIRIHSKFKNWLFGIDPNVYLYLKTNLKLLSLDVIHVHGVHTLYSSEVIFAVRKINKNVPIIFSPHLDVSRSTFVGKYLWNFYVQFIGAKLFKKVTHVVSCSNFEANNIINMFHVSPSNISIIPHGVETINNIKCTSSNNQLSLVYAGYLIKRKSVPHILNGLYSLVNELNFKDVVLTIIGDGPEKNKIVNLVKNLNLEDHVIFKSFLPKSEYLNEIVHADIFLLLSESEAYGIVVAEALAQGTPCIVSNNTALSEFTCENGCYGINYPPNPNRLAQLILSVYHENPTVGPFSGKIRTWERVVDDYEEMYLNLLTSQI